MKKRVYIVYYKGIAEDTFYTLSRALEYIGREINGKRFGSMLVTAASAVRHGYMIQSSLEVI